MNKLILSGIAVSFAAALSASSALADITIATAGPITGPLAANGEQMKQGATMAVADLNKAGGVLGQQIKLEIGDDACDPKQAVAVANDLAGKGVKFVAGHFCSSSSIPASQVYAEEGVMQITPASTNPKFTDGDPKATPPVVASPYAARTCGRDDAQGAVAGAYLAKHYTGKKVAIVDDNSTYGAGLAEQTKMAMNAAGLKEVMNEHITPGEKDYSALVSKLKDAGVDAIYFGGYHPEAGIILKQLTDQGSGAQMLSGDSLADKEFWSIAGEAAAKKMIFTFAPEPRTNPAAKAVVDEFKAAGYDPEGYTLYTYAAVQMWAQAATAVKDTDPKKISAWLRAGNPVQTVLGEMKLDAKGDIVGAKYVWDTFKDGNYTEDSSIN